MTAKQLDFYDIEEYLADVLVPTIENDEGEHAALLFSVGEGHGAVRALIFGLLGDDKPLPADIADIFRATWARTAKNEDIFEPLDQVKIGPPVLSSLGA